MRELSLTKDEYESLSQENKHKQEEIKHYNEQLAVLQRRQEKEKVEEVRAHEEKEKKAEKLAENSKSTKDELV